MKLTKLIIEKEFDEWFYGIYGGGYSSRSEWFYNEIETTKDIEHLKKGMKIWLQSAFQEGFERGIQ